MTFYINPMSAPALEMFARKQAENMNLEPYFLKAMVDRAQLNEQNTSNLRTTQAEIYKQILSNQQSDINNQRTTDTETNNNLRTTAASMYNNQNTVNATLRGQDITANTADKRLQSEEGIANQTNQREIWKENLDNYYKQQNLNLEQQKQLEQHAVNIFNQKMKMDEVDRQDQSNIFGSYVTNSKNGTDPNANKLWQDTVNTLVQKGLIDAKQALAYSNMNPQQAAQESGIHLQFNQYAQAVKDMEKQGNGNLSEKVLSEIQAGKVGQLRSSLDVGNLVSNFDPQQFTTSGDIKSTYGRVAARLGLNSLPGASDAENFAAARSAMSSNVLQSLMSTLMNQKGVRFNKMTLDTLKPEMPTLGEDSPAMAFNKIVTLSQRMSRANDLSDRLLKEGVNPNSKDYQDAINNYVVNDTTPGKLTYTGSQGQREMGYDDINRLVQERPDIFPDFSSAVKYIMQHP